MLRRTLLAAASSQRLHQAVITAPQTRAIVDRYVAGDNTAAAVATARILRATGLLVSLDYLGEDTTDAGQAAEVAATYVGLLGELSAAGLAGGGGCEVSVKATAVGLFLSDHGEKTAAENIARICTAARNAGTTVTLDAEDHTAVGATLRIAAELRADFPDLGCVVQSRLRRTEADCEQLAASGARVRLCKGAYDEPPDVAFTRRQDVDLSYVRCLKLLMAGSGYPMLATHDPRLIDIATALALLTGRGPDRFEYQMLYGIRPVEQQRLADAGSQVRVYVPYGSDWYGYLVRRLAERPGNLAFFLRSLAPSRPSS
ncbi:MAG TPA: proline dehydrogenase family protein [Streptosporangiaceae bacterium]|nr:proline dehydrogenase family protein [Streptosporangiaceae bacterium]